MQRILAWIKSRPGRAGRLFLIILFLGLGTRLLWVVLRTETGASALRGQWRDATIGWFAGKHLPLYLRDPPEQADYWLGETERVLAAHPNDARLMMGAALLLDSPNEQYTARHFGGTVTVAGSTVPLTGSPLSNESLTKADDAFEERCRKRCLELAEQATAIDGGNVQWWRLRALLLFRNASFDRSPRDARWAKILALCRQHDPTNALYDYLAADRYWDTAAKIDWDGSYRERLVVKDPAMAQKAVDCFTRGQAKPVCAIDDVGYTIADEFLRQSRLPRNELEWIAFDRQIFSRRHGLLSSLLHWQGARAQEYELEGDLENALAMQRQFLHASDQFASQEPSSTFDLSWIHSRSRISNRMQMLVADHTGSPIAGRKEEIAQLQRAAKIDWMIALQALRQMGNKRQDSTPDLQRYENTVALIAGMFVTSAPPLVLVLLLTGGIVAYLAGRSSAGESPRIGWITQILTLLAAIGLSFTLFGLTPAEIVSRDAVAWTLSIALLASPIPLAALVGWLWLRKRSYQFSIRAILIVTVIVYLAFALVSALAQIIELPFDFSIPARDCGGIDAGILQAAARKFGNWFWAVYQWSGYGGAYIAFGMWAGIVAACYALKIAIRQSRPDAAPILWRCRLAGLFRAIGRPTLGMAVLLLLAYLAIVPSQLNRAERVFQQEIVFAREPEKYWTEMKEAVERIRSDKAQMKLFEDASRTDQPPATPEEE